MMMMKTAARIAYLAGHRRWPKAHGKREEGAYRDTAVVNVVDNGRGCLHPSWLAGLWASWAPQWGPGEDEIG